MLCKYFTIITAIFILSTSTCSAKDVQQSEAEARKTSFQIIWFHNAGYSTLESLQIAIGSGIVSHVMLLYMHRNDEKPELDKQVESAIHIVKQSNCKLIWARTLWPWYSVADSNINDIFDPYYYEREIITIRNEAKDISADFVAFDTEAYGDSPLKNCLRGEKRIRFNKNQLSLIQAAVSYAIEKLGTVDYVLPAASLDTSHPYRILSQLGKKRISEHTYYDNENKIRAIKYPYEIFGAYLDVQKFNKHSPTDPFFLPGEIFEKSQLWSDKRGLLLYCDSKKAEAVAKGMVQYVRNLRNAGK